MNRWEELHSPRLVGVAEKIALLALDAEEKRGKATLFMDQVEIARAIGEDPSTVALAMRLSYTAEFVAEYGWGFVPLGSGRDGKRHGYSMQHDRALGNAEEIADSLDYSDRWALDHLRGLRAHYEQKAIAHGRNTTIGKAFQRRANMMVGAVAHLEEIASS